MANKPTLDEMRLALDKVLPHHQREANKAKFLEGVEFKERMYHATGDDFNEFDPNKSSEEGKFGQGIYMTPQTRHANFFANIRAKQGKSAQIMPVHTNIKNPYKIHGHQNIPFNKIDKNKLQALGHDGIFYYDDSGDLKEAVAFHPTQVKSAIGNRGTYDTTNPDINKAKGGKVKGPQPLLPKETVKAYKLFRVDQKQPGKLFPLFVDANTPVEKDKWVEAKVGEMIGNKVKSKIGPLAYRPGWHAGDLPVATHIGEKSDNSLTAPDRRPKNQVWAEVEMPNDVDWQSEANRRGTNKQGKLIPVKAHITDQIPLGGHYRYKTNPNITGNWLIGGAMKVNRVLPDEEVQKINKKARVSDLPRSEPINLKDYGFRSGGNVQPLLPKFKE